MIKISKATAKIMLWMFIGIMYFPIYILMWMLRIVARLLLSIAYFGTFESKMGKNVFKSIFSFTYERTF